MHGFEFTQFDIFSLEIIAAQSCNLAMVVSFKAEKKKNRNFWLVLTIWAKGLCFIKCFDGKNVLTLQGYRLVVTVCVGKSRCDQSDHLIGLLIVSLTGKL